MTKANASQIWPIITHSWRQERMKAQLTTHSIQAVWVHLVFLVMMQQTLAWVRNTSQWELITARNEVGARLYFHRRLWFCSQGGGVCLSACWNTNPPGKADPYGKADPPGKETPPCAVHAGRYGQQASGMHPTGMQFLLERMLLYIKIKIILPFTWIRWSAVFTNDLNVINAV